MKPTKIFISIVVLCFAFQLLTLGVRVYVNHPKNFSKVDIDQYNDAEHFYYQRLSQNGKIAYTLLMEQLKEHPEKIEIPQVSDTEYDKMIEAISYDNPDMLCLPRQTRFVQKGAHAYVEPQYEHEAQQCDVKTKELQRKVEEICKEASSFISDYQKELFFHDYICENVCYVDKEDGGYSAYDALICGEAVCEGYSRAMQILLNHEGIYNYLVIGTGAPTDQEPEGHMWNVVALGNQNYYLDVTWDDVENDGLHITQHKYFNVTEKEISTDHKNIEPADNACTAHIENYFYHEGLRFTAYNQTAKSKITKEIEKALSKKENAYIEFSFSNQDAFDSAMQHLLDKDDIHRLMNIAEKNASQHIKIIFIRDDVYKTILFIFEEREN